MVVGQADDVWIGCDRGVAGQREAAGIWAGATAIREGLARPESADEKLPGIQQALAAGGASLHVARRGSVSVGFTLLVPREYSLEVLYLGVDPVAWGSGVGRRILDYIHDYARITRHVSLDLWVIHDNDRAVRMYERNGWSQTGEEKVRNASGRRERRLVRSVT